MKKNKINFSVIINCFNGEKFIESCLLSLKDQTYKNFEIIFFDNNSSDKSVNIFLKNVFNKNFYLHRNKLTISLAEARVEAIKFAKADFIIFLDVDDYFFNTHLDNLEKIIKKNEKIRIIYSKVMIKNEKLLKSYPLFDYSSINHKNIKSLNLIHRYVSMCSCCFNSKLLKSISLPRYKLNHSIDDFIIYSLSYQYQMKIIFSDHFAVNYRLHENNLSNSQGIQSCFESIKVLNTFKYLVSKKLFYKAYQDRIYKLLVHYLINKNYINFFKTLILKSNLIYVLYFFILTISKRNFRAKF